MQLLKDRIRKDGVIKEGNVLKVDSFLNHQMDIALINEMGKEFRRRFPDESINKILTIEASGIGIACITAQYFNCPVVFAKKTQSINIDGEVYSTKIKSFTHGRTYDVIVKKAFLSPEDNILIIDGSFDPFTGPLYDQNGELKVEDGVKMTDDEIWNMNWFVQGVVGSIPA